MLKRLVRITLLAGIVACLGPVASALAATPTYTNDTTNGRWVVFNDDAVWHIYHGCGPNGVGPGYVAYVQMKNRTTGAYDGPVLVDDVNASAADFPAGYTGEDRQIGLGKFVWRNARAAQGATLYYTAQFKNAWPASNRCINEVYSPTGRSGQLGPGALTQDTAKTGTDQRGAYVEIDQAFPLQDMFSPLLRIAYKWRFYAGVARMWSYVESRCADGVCGGTGAPRAWVKGPRYVAGINGTVDGTRFTHLQVFDTQSAAVCAYDRSMSGSGSATGQCPANSASYNGAACANTFETNCPGRDRARVQYDYAPPVNADNPISNQPGCSTTNRCLEAVFRGFNAYPYGPWPSYFIGDSGLTVDTYAWDPFGPNPAMGLSAGWAQNASFRAAEDAGDACSINGLATTDPAYPQATRWELVGFKQNPADYSGSYTYANTFALGWSDCKNVGATEYPIPTGTPKSAYAYGGALYRAYPPAPDGFGGNAYGTFASFSFKDGSTFNPERLR